MSESIVSIIEVRFISEFFLNKKKGKILRFLRQKLCMIRSYIFIPMSYSQTLTHTQSRYTFGVNDTYNDFFFGVRSREYYLVFSLYRSLLRARIFHSPRVNNIHKQSTQTPTYTYQFEGI